MDQNDLNEDKYYRLYVFYSTSYKKKTQGILLIKKANNNSKSKWRSDLEVKQVW